MRPELDASPRRRNAWWWRMSQGGRNAVAVTVAISIFVAIFGVPLLVLQLTRPVFTGDVSVYANIKPGPQATGAPQAMKLKLVIVDTATGKMDHVWDMIIPDYMATKPAEVRTVVQLSWHEVLIGHYEGGGSAYASSVTVKVVDVATSNLIAATSFSNDPPMQFVGAAASDTVAAKPEQQVVDYLRRLPDDSPPSNPWIVLPLIGLFTLSPLVLLCWFLVYASRRARRQRAAGVPGPGPREGSACRPRGGSGLRCDAPCTASG